jgi:hypothetical protein
MNNLLKELGKYFLDISKIVFAVAVITPVVRDGMFSIISITLAIALMLLGTYITYKGVKDD